MEHVAQRMMLGPTEVIICDDKCMTKEEAEKELKELARKLRPYVVKKRTIEESGAKYK